MRTHRKPNLTQRYFTNKEAISVDPTYIPAYENLSRAYYQSGDREHAMESLRRAAGLGSKAAQSLLTMSGETW